MLLTLIVGAVVAVIAFVKAYRESGRVYMMDDVLPAAGYAMFVALFATFGFSPLLCYDNETVTEKVYLESFERSSQISGSFFLGCGSVNGGPAYCYYVKIAEDTYVLRWQDTADSKIVEDGGCYLIKTWAKKPEWSWWVWIKHHFYEGISNEFHIPKGSIKSVVKP